MVKVKRAQGRKLKPPQTEKKFCAYLHRHCTQLRLDGYLYCMSHILEDKNAPYRQCTFTHPGNRRRCTNPSPRNDRHESFCRFHLKQVKIQQSVPETPTKVEPETLMKLMTNLEHYCEDRKHNLSYDPDDLLDQFTYPTDLSEPLDLDNIASGQKIRVSETWLGLSDNSESDTDFSDDEEPLKHAGVYTYEEVARIYKDKLVKLQTLYIEEMHHLQYVLSEKRRDYLRALKNEKRTQGSIINTISRTTKEEIDKYNSFRAMNRYHQVHGQEALLRAKSLKQRLEVSGGPFPSKLFPANEQTCTYINNENKSCNSKALPLTMFCFSHILSDTQQVLFQRCSGDSNSCMKVVIPYIDNAKCLLHCCPESPPHKQRSLSPVAGPSGLQDVQEEEHFQSMDDIASLGLDAVVPGSLFGLNQFGEPDDESTDSCATYGSRVGGDYLYRAPEEYRDELLSETHSDT